MVKQSEIVKAVIVLLKGKYGRVYPDEVVEGFETPCCFLKTNKYRNSETKNVNGNSISVIITYIPSSSDKQIQFLEFEDDISEMFGNSLHVNDRHLRVISLQSQRMGEENDMLQTIINLSYLDATGYDRNYDYGGCKPYELIRDNVVSNSITTN